MNLTIDSNVQNISFNGHDVQKLIFNGVEVWSKSHVNPYESQYFTIVSSANSNTIKWHYYNSSSRQISISSDNGVTWSNVTSSSSGATLKTLQSGEKLLIKGTNSSYAQGGYYNYFSSTKNFNVEGNIMSLIYGDDFIGKTSFKSTTYTIFYYLFKSCTYLIDASNLVLPATTLLAGCYQYMFYGCTGLVSAPKILPATTLAAECYRYMFQGCTSLINVPELPATTLQSNCYLRMFSGCTSLVNAPSLPATTLADYCYQYMFYNCTSLVNAPVLQAATLVQYCYQYMFYNCTSLVTAPTLPATTLATHCYDSMFYNCKSLVNVPTTLPATTLATYCYYNMFYGCSKLTTAPIIPAVTMANCACQTMFRNCKLLNYIKCLVQNPGSATDGFKNWVYGVASTGTFVKNSNMTGTWSAGVNGIPSSWTVQTAGA